MANSWHGIGNLTDDPEMRYTPQETPVVSFSIAINNGRDKNGEDREPTYLDIEAWERLAENVAEYCRKGSKVFVEGPIQVDKWVDRESGTKRKSYKIRAFKVEFLTPKSREDGEERPARTNTRPTRRAPRDDLDDLPF